MGLRPTPRGESALLRLIDAKRVTRDFQRSGDDESLSTIKKADFFGATKHIALATSGQLSDEALSDSQKEIFGVGVRLLHDPPIVSVFDLRLMKYKVHRDLRSVSSLYEHPGTLCESVICIPFCYFLGRRKAGFGFALMFAKLHRG